MKLYGVRTSPYVRHARVALAQSKLDWEFEQVTLETIGQSPTLRVPFLTDGNLILSDSSVIVRYVREQSSQPYLATIADHELFALATSVLDTAVNVYLMNIGDSKTWRMSPAGRRSVDSIPKATLSASRNELPWV